MALQPTRLEYRLTLSNVDRGRELTETVIVARHPSETQAHVTLRMLAFCLLHEDGLAFGPGLSTPDSADLWTHDLTGRLRTFIECGYVPGERLRNVQKHNPDVAVHLLTDEPHRAKQLLDELHQLKLPRASSPVSVWTVDAGLVRALAEREERRQKWSVTVVGDHFYVDADGRLQDGAVSRST